MTSSPSSPHLVSSSSQNPLTPDQSTPDQSTPDQSTQSHSLHLDSRPILVTGAGGFLGSALSRFLLDKGFKVRGFARGHYPHLQELGIDMIQGDLKNKDQVSASVQGCQAVFHVAALAGAWGSYERYYQTNVVGTRNIIQACRIHSVSKLIFTSSPSVVHHGTDLEGVDESIDYPSSFSAYYPQTKAQAEQEILQANDSTLSTVALRPHLIWGPGDQHLIPRILDRADRGRLRHLAPEKRVDSIYIDDAVLAHWCAFQHLHPQANCAGKAYFISQGEPWSIKGLMNGILTACDRPEVHKTLSPKIAYWIGFLFEGIYRLFRIQKEPLMTRFIAEQLSTAHWYNVDASQQDLNFTPQYTIQQALDRLHHHHQRHPF